MIGHLLICLFFSAIFTQEQLVVPSQGLESSESIDSSFTSTNTRLLTQDSYMDMFDFDREEPAESAVTMRLYGNTIMGYYYVTLFFGSPLQRQNLIIDTGSTITTVPCTGIVIKALYL